MADLRRTLDRCVRRAIWDRIGLMTSPALWGLALALILGGLWLVVTSSFKGRK